MATISFKEELVISDPNVIKSIAQALKQPKNPNVSSVQPPKLPENAGSIWFKPSEK